MHKPIAVGYLEGGTAFLLARELLVVSIAGEGCGTKQYFEMFYVKLLT